MTVQMTKDKDTSQNQTDKTTHNIREADIIGWLRKNPDFLQENPEICDLLLPPRQYKERGVADFQKFMVERLREDRDGIIEEAREIVETSRANMQNLSRIQCAILSILDSRNFEDFIHTIVMDSSSLLNVDIITIVVEAEDGVIPHINLSGVHIVPPGTVALLMKNQKIMLEADIAGVAEIFGGGAGLVRSQAFAKLDISSQMPPVMIALGSRDPHLFQDGQATEMLSFFAQVTERAFRRWLDISTAS
jgi:uncharacterized protein YigA (DUF484 family)